MSGSIPRTLHGNAFAISEPASRRRVFRGHPWFGDAEPNHATWNQLFLAIGELFRVMVNMALILRRFLTGTEGDPANFAAWAVWINRLFSMFGGVDG